MAVLGVVFALAYILGGDTFDELSAMYDNIKDYKLLNKAFKIYKKRN